MVLFYNRDQLFSTKLCYRYRIRPNYRILRFGFSKLLGKFVVKYVSTFTEVTLKKDQRRTYLMKLMRRFCVCVCVCFVIFFIKAYAMGTLKKDQRRTYLMKLMRRFCVCVCVCFVIFFIKAYAMGD